MDHEDPHALMSSWDHPQATRWRWLIPKPNTKWGARRPGGECKEWAGTLLCAIQHNGRELCPETGTRYSCGCSGSPPPLVDITTSPQLVEDTSPQLVDKAPHTRSCRFPDEFQPHTYHVCPHNIVVGVWVEDPPRPPRPSLDAVGERREPVEV